jgi:hypothetical protein
MSGEVHYLDCSDYPKWDSLVQASPQGAVSSLSWWLEALGSNTRVLGYFENGRLVAGIPLHRERMFGVTIYRKPKLTYPWGVIIEPLTGKTSSVTTRKMHILDNLAKSLARIKGSIIVSFHPSLENWLPFYWHGFCVSLGITHVIENLERIDHVRKELTSDARRLISKAIDRGIIVEPCGFQEGMNLFRQSYRKQHRRLPYSDDYFRRLYAAAKAHDAGECFVARDSEGQAHAANFAIWDRERAYGIASGTDLTPGNGSAGTLLMWHMIEFAADRTKSFDFCGTTMPSIEHFLRSFGARQESYPRVLKLSLLPRICWSALRMI